MDEAEELCDRLAIVNQGKLLALDSPLGLTSKYATNMKAAFSYEGDDLPSMEDIPRLKKSRASAGRWRLRVSGLLSL